MQAPLFTGSGTALGGGTVFTVLLACACASDIRSRRIPNQLVGLLALTGVVFSTALGASPLRALLVSVAGICVGFVLWVPFYLLRWLGAGDVKMFAAAGAWLGPIRTVQGAFVAAIIGGILATLWMVRAYGVKGTAAAASCAIASPRSITNHPVDRNHRRALPYGVALGIGAALMGWFPGVVGGVFHVH